MHVGVFWKPLGGRECKESCLRTVDILIYRKRCVEQLERDECVLDICVVSLFIRQNYCMCGGDMALFGMPHFFPRHSAEGQDPSDMTRLSNGPKTVEVCKEMRGFSQNSAK